MSSCLSPWAYRTVPFLWRWSKLGWTSLGVSMVKCLPAQHPEAAPAADCSSICSLYLFSGLFFYSLLSLSWMLSWKTVVPGLVLPGVCASLALTIFKVPGCGRMGAWGMCPATPGRMLMGIWGHAWPPPAAAALAQPHLPQCSFSLEALYQHLILVQSPISCSVHASLLLSLSQRSGGHTDRWEQPLVSELHLQLSPGRTGFSITCHPQTLLHFCSPKSLLVLFREEWSWTILYIIKIGAKLFLSNPSSPHFFFSNSCLFFTQSNTE